jgi:hypothetical protein
VQVVLAYGSWPILSLHALADVRPAQKIDDEVLQSISKVN